MGTNFRVSKISELACWWLFCTAVFAVIASRLSTDGTPDFRLYHFYNGFAAHNNRTAYDIVPAQMQTSFFNGLDSIYYLIFTALNNKPMLLNMILSIPYSLAAFLVFLMTRLFVDLVGWRRDLVSAMAALFGLSGAAALPTIATTMSDIVPGVPILFSLLIWLYLEKNKQNSRWTSIALGCCAGLSVGLKLTYVPIFVAILLNISLRRLFKKESALSEAFLFGLSGFVVFVAVDAQWLWNNYHLYQNPIFPLMNNVFKSDLVAPVSWADTRFFPKTLAQRLFYPFFWAVWPSQDVIELDMRDPRILIGCVSAIICVAAVAYRSARKKSFPIYGDDDSLRLSVAVVFLVSYLLWESLWSIYRYLALQECLSGVLLLIALEILLDARLRRSWIYTVFGAVVFISMSVTEYPWWPRAAAGPKVMSVKLPQIEPNAMVLFLDGYAYSYLIPFMPSTVRAISVNSNLGGIGSVGLLSQRIDKAVRDHKGPLWGMEYTYFDGAADPALQNYHLVRGECTLLDANVDEDRDYVRICRLKRN